MNSNVAIFVVNMVQFYSIKNCMDKLVGKGINVDLLVLDDFGYGGLVDFTTNEIRKLGYNPINKLSKKKKYKILLEPYPIYGYAKSSHRVEFEYRINYKYYLISAKPKPVYTPDWNNIYDAIAVHSRYEFELQNAYTRTHFVRTSRHITNKTKKEANQSKKILYLPTFDDVKRSDYKNLETSFQLLRTSYKILIKAHHGTQFLDSEKEHDRFLKEIADEYYDQSTPLYDLIENTDAVITGNSGSIYDAIYLKKPVSIFTDNVNKYKFIVNSLQHEMVKNGILPFTNNPNKIPEIVNESFDKIKDQSKFGEYQFHPKDIFIEDLFDVVMRYLEKIKKEDTYCALKNHFKMARENEIKENNDILGNNANLSHRIVECEQEITNLKRTIEQYEKSTSWKLTKPLRYINYKLINPARK